MGHNVGRPLTPDWQRADELAEALAADLRRLQEQTNKEVPKRGRQLPASPRAMAASRKLPYSKTVIHDALKGKPPAILDGKLVAGIAGYCLDLRGIGRNDDYWQLRAREIRDAAELARNESMDQARQDLPRAVVGGELMHVPPKGLVLRDRAEVPERFRDWVDDPRFVVMEDSEWVQDTEMPEGDGKGRLAKVGWRGLGTGVSRVAAVMGAAAVITAVPIVLTQVDTGGDRQPFTSQDVPPVQHSTNYTNSSSVSSSPATSPSAGRPSAKPAPAPAVSRTPTSAAPAENKESTPWPAADFGAYGLMANALSGKCVDPGVTKQVGTDLYQWDCAAEAVNQGWALNEVRVDTFQLKNEYSDLCLNLNDTLSLVLDTCAEKETQLWHFRHNADSKGWSYYFINNAAHTGKCLDVSQASMDKGATVGAWDCTEGAANQNFRFESEVF